MWNGSLPISACKKKLYLFDPKLPPTITQTQRTRRKQRAEPSDPKSLERAVRQLLADKISGNQVGIWLLVPEHLRLGTWDLVRAWTRESGPAVQPRLALQLIHESALCVHGIRQGRSLSQKGFELVNGLPFVATDQAIHDLLADHTMSQAQSLQCALGKLRLASGHFSGRLLAIDPHRLTSCSKRQMRRHREDATLKPVKTAQTFFCVDAQTFQPVCLLAASSARTVAQATPELLDLAQSILNPSGDKPSLVMADCEHYNFEILQGVRERTGFDMLVPMPNQKELQTKCRTLEDKLFTRHWAGYATTKQLWQPKGNPTDPFHWFIQRSGERPEDYHFKSFVCTADRPELADLSAHYPQRWHVEEFFKLNQALGWQQAGTLNLNIRYGRMSLALIAQTVIYQLRQRIGQPLCQWDAAHFAKDLFGGLEGDIRVEEDTIVVTYYNAPNVELLRSHYEGLPDKLCAEGIKPEIPWLFDFKLDFRFK